MVRLSRVVLLGGSGFIGRHLQTRLRAEDVEVLSFSSAQLDLCAEDVSQQLASRIDKEDSVVFLAAVTPDKGRDAHTQLKNLKMGENVCAFFEKNACAHLVYLSSDAVYAEGLPLIRESSPCDPGSLYGLAHLMRERMLTEALKKNGMPLMILRPSIVYGMGDTHRSYGPNRFFHTALNEEKITLFGNGEEKRDHVYVRDLCELLHACLFSRSHGILNAATGHGISFGDVALQIQKLFGGRLKIETTSRANPVTHRHFDVTGLAKMFPRFQWTPLQKGLAETYHAISKTRRSRVPVA